MEKKTKKKAVVEQPLPEPTVSKGQSWEVKDRLYELQTTAIPPVYILRSRQLFYFDEDKGYEREIKYCRNQNTVFVDEMKGPQRLGHIVFRNGQLFVEKEQRTLQEFLSKYHPESGKTYMEHNAEAIAESDIDYLEMELEALNAAASMDIDRAEAILRTDIGNRVSQMTSKELRRDLMVFARNNAKLFLDLANDEDISIRNTGIRAVEAGIIKLSNDNRHFKWGTNDRKLFDVPFDENPYSALASWFKTDEGVDVFKQVEKRLK
tara:strand:+ start:927 stop:1718 length:792 start_codon:yes stop_codon:yes gene_type:complete